MNAGYMLGREYVLIKKSEKLTPALLLGFQYEGNSTDNQMILFKDDMAVVRAVWKKLVGLREEYGR